MKAIVMNKSGDVSVLGIQDIDEPKLPIGYIKIKNKAFGINRAEAYFRSGAWGEVNKPSIPGIEAAGEVVEDNSGNFRIGQKVITVMGGLMLARDGSYAEYVIAPASNVLAVETTLAWEELGALPQAYLTIWGAMDKNLAVKKGQSLLVRGGTTTLGMAAITYAKARGLNVVATTRYSENIALLKSIGANEVVVDKGMVAEKVRSIYPNGVDNVIDVVGAGTVKDSMSAVKMWGQVCVVGVLTGTVVEHFDLHSDLPNTVKLSFFASGLLGSHDMQLSKSPLQWVIKQIETGKIPSIVTKVYAFDQIQEAHQSMENNQILGKAVVKL